MNAYIEPKIINQLMLDARSRPVESQIVLNVINKKDPASWYMTFNQTRIDAIAVKTLKSDYATLLITINSSEPLYFAKAGTYSPRQVLPGLLFVTGNHTINDMKAVSSQFIDDDVLKMVINPCEFWYCHSCNQQIKTDGNQIGFRFVVVDQAGESYMSNDPMISGPDFEPL